jgi:hypothetical protein
VSRLFFETNPPETCPIAFGGPSGVLVHFLSLAFSTRYGSIHPLSQLALLLRGEMKIDLRPLTTFADRNAEEEADERELERVWQDAGPLAETLSKVTDALAVGDERIAVLTEDAPDLAARLGELREMAAWAAGRGLRARLTFEL